MISIFRKIRQKLLNQNKAYTYLLYAIGEIFLVVIGILIALQINNWNELQKNIEKEKYYLNSVKSSIELSQEELTRIIIDADNTTSSAKEMYLILKNGSYEKSDPEIFDDLIFMVANYSVMTLNDGGIREILNTGSLDIIRNEKIRVFLASWDERIHRIRKYETESATLARDYVLFMRNFYDISRYQSKEYSSIIIPERKEEFLSDPMLRNLLNRISITHENMFEMYSEERSDLDSLNLMINSYLSEL